MSENDDTDTGDTAVDDPIVEMRQSELSKLMGKTRREGAASAARKAGAAPQTTPQTIAEIVAATVAALKPTEAAPPRVAAAPSAPNGSSLPTENGLTNVFAPGAAVALGPKRLRQELEKIWAQASELQGKPPLPTVPGSGRK